MDVRRQKNQATRKIGLALSGGTFKAAAHVGVLAALETLGIVPDCIAGTSAGSLVATLYAHGYSASDLRGLIRRFPIHQLLDFGFPVLTSLVSLLRYKLRPTEHLVQPIIPRGLLTGRRLRAYVQDLLRDRTPTVPYYVIATDLMSGAPVTLTNDDSAIKAGIAYRPKNFSDAVVGSCSLPGILSPVPIDRWLLVDGAFRHYVPVNVLRQVGCTKIIAINLYQLEPNWKPETIISVLTRSFEIMLRETIDNDVDGPDLFVLEPPLKHTAWASYREMGNYISEGERIVEKRRHSLIQFLQSPNSEPVNRPRVIFHAKDPCH